ncbi:MAG: ABC transporter permease subunit [Gammaproteobacteria bacterium]|nr:ABC transporter permease subunit [Gammaproteobacteria bacterium]HJN66941.1 ABC transporter permease subunit [Pirellulales bacterium]
MTLMAQHGSKPMLRWVLLVIVLGIAASPALPLVVLTLGQEPTRSLWTDAFSKSTGSTLYLGAGVSVFSLVIGLPLGLLAALYRFPARRPLILFQALPLLLPSFLLCIGWSNLAAAKWLWWLPTPDGLAGCVFVLGLQMMPLPFFATWAAGHNLTASQIDSVRLHGGERSVLTFSARACAPVAILAALLGGILSLSDTGAPLIFGYRSAAVEIRTSFSALFDYELAGRQCLLLAGLALLLIAPVLFVGLRLLAAAVLARQTRPAMPYPHRALSWVAPGGLLLVLIVGVVVPTLGLCWPAAENPMIERAATKVAATAGTTLIFTGGAAVIAVLFATLIALATSASARGRLFVLAVLLLLLAMPPALAAIGVSRIATGAPPQLDWLMRSRLTVALILGLRFLPVATVAMMFATCGLSPSWRDAARIHGVSRVRMFVRVTLPYLSFAIVVSLLLVMVLAATDITTTHLLQPPGDQSLPVAIFTVMANSPEGLVASLCLLYLLCVVLLLAAASQLPRLWSRRSA